MKRRSTFLIVAVLVAAFMLPVSAMAENDPRDAVPAPGGTSLFLFYYRDYTGSDVYEDGETLDDNADFDLQVGIFRLAHFWDVGGNWIWSADVLQPVASMNFDSDVLFPDNSGANSSGLGDTTIATHINTPFFLDNGKFKLGQSYGLIVTLPTGDYDSEKAANIGTNYYTYRLEATPVILMSGPFVFELTGEVNFYSDNDDYTVANLKQEKDPSYQLQLHASYSFTDSFLFGISYYYLTGGETTVAGIEQDDEPDAQALRFSFGFQLTKNLQMLLQYNTEIERENGVEQNYLGTRLAYCF
ncbi:transporter [uncultured Desulfosarcina sp.]|uniref:transporter n=1 Tax=uncultured Desulfosarcina sp. TaxID=218289 RepID=UPI0029C77E88|nr:transporter [uncultured Desulfosarcina sp.]